jgi:CRP/FNR family transcriptional regulator, cyclic AMP receptor protein
MGTHEFTGLRSITLFQRLSDEALSNVSAALALRHLEANQVIFQMGDLGEELYIVHSGRLAIYVPNPEQPEEERPIRILEASDVLGEMALIDQEPRSLSAKALEPSEVWVLTATDFSALIESHPEVALSVMGGLNDRIRYTTQFLSEVRDWVKRIAQGQYDRAFAPDAEHQDPSITALAAEFTQMAAQVEAREAELRQQVVQLQIQIDTEKKERQVNEIVGSDYFQSLAAQARELKKKK